VNAVPDKGKTLPGQDTSNTNKGKRDKNNMQNHSKNIVNASILPCAVPIAPRKQVCIHCMSL